MVKTITCDRGTEFANWAEIEQALNCDVYFADPYCAWQKGSNENSNGLLREFYPKGRNLSRVSPTTLKRNLALINARPRKVLKFVSAQYLWDLELQKVLHLVWQITAEMQNEFYDPLCSKSDADEDQYAVIEPFFLKKVIILEKVGNQHRHRPKHRVHGKSLSKIQMQQWNICPGHTASGAGNGSQPFNGAGNVKRPKYH